MYLLFLISLATLALAEDDPATDQLIYFKKKNPVSIGELTTSTGSPVFYNEATSTLNTNLLLNPYLMESITHLVRERIPERSVHARGAGAFGYFKVTKDISHICKADLFSKVGKETPVAVRFSQSTGERGFSEVIRDTRGFAMKFYTLQGILDILAFNTEIYSYNDPLLFPTFAKVARRNPATNLLDPKTYWDTMTLNPISLQLVLLLYADRGIPASYRNMPGFANHLFQVENSRGEIHFMKFHILPTAGIKNLSSKEAKNISATDPDFYSRDLYRAIAKCNYPSWTMYAQILTKDNVDDLGPRAFDVTRTISVQDYPLQEIGELFLNRNPKNYFAEMEQLAFCPGNLVPGILGAPDKLFEGRVLAYKDAHMYRLGVNTNKIPVNCPFQVPTYTYNKDGVSPVNDNENDAPGYYPNSFSGPVPSMYNKTSLISIVESNEVGNKEQTTAFYNALDEDERIRLIQNLVASLSLVNETIQKRAVNLFTDIHSDLGSRVSQELIKANTGNS